MKTNEQIFDETFNLLEFLQAGGTWTIDQYVKYLKSWEMNVGAY